MYLNFKYINLVNPNWQKSNDYEENYSEAKYNGSSVICRRLCSDYNILFVKKYLKVVKNM